MTDKPTAASLGAAAAREARARMDLIRSKLPANTRNLFDGYDLVPTNHVEEVEAELAEARGLLAALVEPGRHRTSLPTPNAGQRSPRREYREWIRKTFEQAQLFLDRTKEPRK